MTGLASSRAPPKPDGVARAAASTTAPDAGTVAWLVAVPCAAVAALAVLLLGPPLGELLYPAEPPFDFLPGDPERITPEPLEGTRYLILLGATMLLTSAIVAAARWRPAIPERVATPLAAAAQLLAAGIVVLCLVNQHEVVWRRSYFDRTTLVVAAALAIALVLAVRGRRGSRTLVDWLRDRETPLLKHVILLAAVLVTAVWILPAVNSERSITWWLDPHDNAFHFDETFAVLNGLTPLTDFNAQYGSLFPYFIALPMLLVGKTYLVFTTTLCAISVLALTAIYGAVRRAANSSLVALGLYVPFVATSVFIIEGEAIVRGTPGTYFPMFPLRYGGPFLLAGLVAWHVERKRTPSALPVFIAAGFVLMNNFEFGLAALGATGCALLWTMRQPTRAHLLRLAGSLLAGVTIAATIYASFSLLRAGAIPDYTKPLKFARLYGVAGYSVAPIPGAFGLPLIIFMTYAAAIATATVRALNGEPNRVLTALLVWSGVFGLGAGTYYVARSEATLLPTMFSPWALALVLLTIVMLQRLARHPKRRPDVATLLVLFGIGIAACSAAQVPLPWDQVQRIQRPPPGAFVQSIVWPAPPPQVPAARFFVGALADGSDFTFKPGAPIALLLTTGHRIADDYGVVNTVPYTGPESIHSVEQLEETLDALRDAGGNTVVAEATRIPMLNDTLRARGFAILTRTGLRRSWPGEDPAWRGIVTLGGLVKWVDMRHLHPAALR